MRTSFRLASVFALAALSAPASPLVARGAQTGAATPETRALAVQIVATSGDPNKLVAGLQPMQAGLVHIISSTVGANESASQAKIAAIVHDVFSSLSSRIADAEVDTYATHFSASELRGILAFLTGPGGRAEVANLPLLKVDIGAGIRMNEAEAATTIRDAEAEFAKAPPARQALILRIFAAQKTEMHIRRGHAALTGVIDRVADRNLGAAPDLQKGAQQAHDLDAYVDLVMAIERRFYVRHYTDAELANVATYLESQAGQAVIDRLPLIQRAVGEAVQAQLSQFLSTIDRPVCSAVPCSAEQRTQLKAGAQQASEVMSMMVRNGL
jgi:hypothetical protein